MTKEIHNFYAIEGLDGVGKSTAVEGLRKRGFFVFKTPPEFLEEMRDSFDEEDYEKRFLFYLLGVVHAGKELTNDTLGDRTIYGDRYLLTTLAAHDAMQVPDDFIESFSEIYEHIPKPQATLLLLADDSVREERLSKRGKDGRDEMNANINPELLSAYRKWADKLGYRLIEIDTTDLSPEEVVRAIEDKVDNGNT